MPAGTLFLLPTGLGAPDVVAVSPPVSLAALHRIRYFVAENPKTARAFLKAARHPSPLQDLRIETLDEHTREADIPALLAPVQDGSDCGLLSEAGAPAIADPGAPLVRAAHAASIRVAPLVGPSAILLALMASGLDGQRFTFHGYLPVERGARIARLVQIEKDSEREYATQLFIEAPYRNDAVLHAIVEACRPDTLLCLATDLTLASESIRTLTVALWKKEMPRLERRPTVFLLYRTGAERARSRAKR